MGLTSRAVRARQLPLQGFPEATGAPATFTRTAWEDLMDNRDDLNKDLSTRGAENQVKGSAKELEGKIRGTVGDATDNESEQLKGKAQELGGKIQKNFGKAEDNIDRNT
jgi:uncharacterized protein YjbJ (UPF0337 family)